MPTPAVPAKPPARQGIRLGMRWKLLIGFGAAFTLVFVVIAVWVLRFTTSSANDRVLATLHDISVGGAASLDVAAFEELLTLDPRVEVGATYPAGAGDLAGTAAAADSVYPTDPRYWEHAEELADIRRTNPEASPYTYYLAPDGVMRFVGSWGAFGYPRMGVDPPFGAQFMQDVTAWVYGDTLRYVRDGLDHTVAQPAYTDNLGRWVSVYSPIVAPDGRTVGALGVDLELSYVDQVRNQVLRVVYPVLGVSYLVLLTLIVLLSGSLTHRLERLSSATARVAEGEYSVDLHDSARALFHDEMTDLAEAFAVMVDQVGRRERVLVEQVEVLKVEIDEQKRHEAVSAITDSDFFNDLTAKAGAMRARMKAADVLDEFHAHNPDIVTTGSKPAEDVD